MTEMSHRQAVLTMVGVTFLWSIAGIVSRQLEQAAAFEVTFWRSASNALALAGLLAWRMGPTALWQRLRQPDRLLWASGACWTVMFTAFMVALTVTSVAHVLITMALAPVFTALLARWTLGHKLAARTQWAIAVAALGIGAMFGREVLAGRPQDLLGMAIALSVPLAGATMWTLLQQASRRGSGASGSPHADMTPAVLLGALGSALLSLPLAWPLRASAHDIAWLSLLGVFQLAVPCMLAVRAGRVLKAPEAALLGLLEVVMGVAWTWLGAGERPQEPVLWGGAVVLLALAGNEVAALTAARAPTPADGKDVSPSV